MVIQKLRVGDFLGENLDSGRNVESRLSPQNYTPENTPEDEQYEYFEDSLAVCCIGDPPPKQAVQKKFRDKFTKLSSPLHFKWWRNCWDESEITSDMMREWIEKCNRLGWSERLGIVAAQPINGGAA